MPRPKNMMPANRKALRTKYRRQHQQLSNSKNDVRIHQPRTCRPLAGTTRTRTGCGVGVEGALSGAFGTANVVLVVDRQDDKHHTEALQQPKRLLWSPPPSANGRGVGSGELTMRIPSQTAQRKTPHLPRNSGSPIWSQFANYYCNGCILLVVHVAS